MKILLVTLFGISFLAGFADAQTYSRIVLTNFVGSGSSYSATTNITIAAGTVVQVAGNFVSGDIGISGPNNYAQTMYVIYAEDPFTPTYPSGATWAWENMPILGPCTLTLTAKATDNNHPAAYAILQILRATNYSRIVLTNFVGSGSSYSATTNITVAAGTVVQVVGNFVSGDIGISGPNNYAQTMYVTYAEDPFTPTYPSGATWAWENMPILGPCWLTLTATATDNNHPAAYAILQIQPAN
jgi:hypothetical protein